MVAEQPGGAGAAQLDEHIRAAAGLAMCGGRQAWELEYLEEGVRCPMPAGIRHDMAVAVEVPPADPVFDVRVTQYHDWPRPPQKKQKIASQKNG